MPSIFSCTYRSLDGDNNVKNCLCYLIPHTTKSLIFPNALLFIPAIITCMELFVCPQNHESLLTTIRLVCITEGVQQYATFMPACLFYSPFSSFLTHSTLLLLYPFLFSFSILFRGINHICVPCLVFFSCIYRRLDRDNKVKNYLCYLIPHTTKSLIFPNALLFIPAIITCMELFVCPRNDESSLITIRLVCITKVLQEYATFMMIILVWRKH